MRKQWKKVLWDAVTDVRMVALVLVILVAQALAQEVVKVVVAAHALIVAKIPVKVAAKEGALMAVQV